MVLRYDEMLSYAEAKAEADQTRESNWSKEIKDNEFKAARKRRAGGRKS